MSFIEFLNALPLGWGLMQGGQRDAFDLLYDVPSECARHLASKQADVGLIPVIEYLRIPDLRILPGISIASRHEVKSVVFVSKKPIEEVSTIALDSSSRTSAALLQILIRKHFGQSDKIYFEAFPEPARMLDRADAALLIGNQALKAPLDGLRVYDLAAEWNRFTGLPFVFAFWAVREGVELGKQAEAFYASREEGMAAIDEISAIYSKRLDMHPDSIRDYLLSNLDFSLDEINLAGLHRFYELAREMNLVGDLRPLRFVDVPEQA